MTEVSKSPNRHTFQRDNYIKRCEEDGKEPSPEYLEMFEKARAIDDEWANDPESHANDMEYDLRTTQWILEKVRNSDTYAQNLYAAMCNMRFQKRDVLQVLKDEYWSCSWRSAGGIIADMRREGDYIDWYCSGIDNRGDDGQSIDTEYHRKRYVPEGFVTPEIEMDLYSIGWVHSEWPDDKD